MYRGSGGVPGAPGGGLPAPNGPGDVLISFDGLTWAPNAQGLPDVNDVLLFDGAVWMPGKLATVIPVPGIMQIPAPILATIGDKSFRYVVPIGPVAPGLVSTIGNQNFPQSTATTPALTNTDLRTSSVRVHTTTSIANTLVGMHYTDPGACRGAVPGVGGFFMGFRFALQNLQADSIVCVGLNNAVLAGGANPSATANRICFGADTADANLTLITVDNGAVATKTPLTIPITKLSMIAGDPNTAGSCVFEAQFWALPNAASVHAKLVNKSTGVTLHDADIALTLPLATTTLRPTCIASSKALVVSGTQHDFIHSWFYY